MKGRGRMVGGGSDAEVEREGRDVLDLVGQLATQSLLRFLPLLLDAFQFPLDFLDLLEINFLPFGQLARKVGLEASDLALEQRQSCVGVG